MLKHSDGKPAFSGLMPGKDGKLPKMEASKRPDEVKGEAKPEPEAGEKSSTMTEKSDGMFHVEHQGETSEHPDMGHALMAMAAHHKPEGKHVHAHHDGMSVHSHGIHGGEHDGPNEHASGEEAGQHMGSYLSDGDEQSSSDYPSGEQDHEGLQGFSG